jgi:hypothetical protein
MVNLAGVLKGLTAQRNQLKQELDRLDTAIGALTGMNGRGGKTARSAGLGAPRRRMSAAGRRRIAAAQRARWAKWKAKQKQAA